MNKIERSNHIREQINNTIPDCVVVMIEHLREGFCRIDAKTKDCPSVEVVFHINDSIEGIVGRVNAQLIVLQHPFSNLLSTFDTPPLLAMGNGYAPIDVKLAEKNLTAYSSLFTAEEIAESNLTLKMTRANRVWLLENKKVLLNTKQNYKFHELANKVRMGSPVDMDKSILEAFIEASKE